MTSPPLLTRLGTLTQEQAELQHLLGEILRLLAQPLSIPPRTSAVSEAFLTVPEVAALLKVHRATIYTWMAQRGLPSQYVGTRRRISRTALDHWLTEQADGNH